MITSVLPLLEIPGVQFITVIVLTAAAIKGIIDFVDWAKGRAKQKLNKEEAADSLAQRLETMEKTHCQHIEALQAKDRELQEQLAVLIKKMDILVESDRDDIKAWITAQYHFFMEQKWIDSYSLDCLEKRYSHYKTEGGNSFIDGLISEIRSLPKRNPYKHTTESQVF